MTSCRLRLLRIVLVCAVVFGGGVLALPAFAGSETWTGSATMADTPVMVTGVSGVSTQVWREGNTGGVGWTGFSGGTGSGLLGTYNAGVAGLVIDSTGTPNVVWTEADSRRDDASYRWKIATLASGAWSVHNMLNQPVSSIAADSTGGIVAVGASPDLHSLFATRYVNGVVTDTDTIVSYGASDVVCGSAVGADNAGHVEAVWCHRDDVTGDYSIKHSSYADGVWSAPDLVSAGGAYVDGVSIDGGGNDVFAVMWRRDNASSAQITTRVLVNGVWGATRINSANGYVAAYVGGKSVDVDSAGVVREVWGEGSQLKFIEYSGSWGAPETIANNLAGGFSIGVGTAATVTVAWRTNSRISIASRIAGVWGSTDSVGGIDSTDPVISPAPSGTAYVFWATRASISGARIPKTFRRSTPSLSGTPTTLAVGPGSVTITVPSTEYTTGATFTSTCTSSNGGTMRSASGATPGTVNGLTINKTYTCGVSASDEDGTSSTVTTAPFTAAGTPGTPTVSAAVSGDGSALVTITDGATNGSATLMRDVSCRSSDGGTTRTASTSESSVTVYLLSGGYSYQCFVTVTNGLGASSEGASTTFTGATRPSAPGRPTLTLANGGLLLASFSGSNMYGSTLSQYMVNCTSSDGGAFASGAGALIPVTVRGATSGKTYTCEVLTSSNVGRSASSSSSSATRHSWGDLAISSVSGRGTIADSLGFITCGASCASSYAPGQSVTLTGTPEPGWVFSSWGGACSGTSATCTVLMSQAREVSASFSELPAAPVPPTPSSSPASSTPAAAGNQAGASGTAPTPSGVRWAAPRIGQPITATFRGFGGIVYSIAATFKKKTMRGTCTASGGNVTCSVTLKAKGAWVIGITPKKNGTAGSPAKKTIKV